MSDAMNELQEFLHALASETRQKILFQVFIDGQAHTVGQVAEVAGLGQSTASEHLAVLKRAGILTSQRAGKEVYYRPDRARILACLRYLTGMLANCCGVQ